MVEVKRRVVLPGVAALVAGLLIGPFTPRAAHAQWGYCESDPVVSLSDGAQVDMSADISTDLSNVQHVTYTLHVPAGDSVVSIVNTDGLMGIYESVQVIADEPAATYQSVTTVRVSGGQVPVTAKTAVTSLPTLGTLSASGLSGNALTITFTPTL